VSELTPDDFGAVLLSLQVALVAILFGMPVALATAYAQTRSRFAVRVVLDTLVTLPLVLPPVATGYVLLLMFGRRGAVGAWLEKIGVVFAFDWTGAALAAGVMAFPLMVRPMRIAIEAIDREVDEVARTLGAGGFIRFFRITLPLAAPGVAAGAILGFAKALGEFGATITFAGSLQGVTRTLPLEIYLQRETDPDAAVALALVLVTVAVIVMVVTYARREIR
jgi:molybdate transport system permease protein